MPTLTALLLLLIIDRSVGVAPRRGAVAQDVSWGCGLSGHVPVNTSAETQRLLVGLKSSSTYGKVTYYGSKDEYASGDVLYQPEQWQPGVTNVDALGWNMEWLRSFVRNACDGCSEVSCGCPTHLGWNFFANDCRPEALGSYTAFQTNLDNMKALMEEFPQLQGAVISEVGMLNCCQHTSFDGTTCETNGPMQKYAGHLHGNLCPKTKELPKGIGSFLETLLDMVAKSKTADGRQVVKSFTWVNKDAYFGSYDLRLFDTNEKVSSIGESYIRGCSAWAASMGVV